MTPQNRYVVLAVVGWVAFAGMGLAIALGPDSWINGAIFAAVGALMAAWVWFRRSRPALVVSLVLGALHCLEQLGYITADISDGSMGLLAADVFFLVAGVAIVVGSFAALRAGRRQPTAAAI